MKYLAIDIGSSFLKGAVLDLDRCRCEVSQRMPTPERLAAVAEGYFEISPDALCDGVCTMLDRLLELAPDAEGLIMCTQMHGMVLTNARGDACSNAITWQDQRGSLPRIGAGGGSDQGMMSYVEWLEDRLSPELRMDLGNELRPGIPISTLAWLTQEGDLPDEELQVVSLPDYVLSQLSQQPAVVDPTNAASYGLFDVRRGKWSEEALEAAGLQRFRLPRVVEAEEWRACYQLSYRGKMLSCPAPVGDHQCALLGSVLREGELSINVSTGSQVSALCRDFHVGDFQVRPFFEGKYLHTVTHIPAGRSLSVLVRLLTELASRAGTPVADPWTLVDQAVEEVESTDLVVDLSFFKAGKSRHRGAVTEIDEQNLTVGHLFRAAFAGMATDYAAHAAKLPGADDWSGIVFSGGVAHKVQLLRALIASEIGIPSRLSSTMDDTLNGLLILASVASGQCENIGESIRRSAASIG